MLLQWSRGDAVAAALVGLWVAVTAAADAFVIASLILRSLSTYTSLYDQILYRHCSGGDVATAVYVLELAAVVVTGGFVIASVVVVAFSIS